MNRPVRIEDRIEAALAAQDHSNLTALAAEAAEVVRSLRKQLNDEIREAQREIRDAYANGLWEGREEV
jgi:hypothetical protein